MLVLGTCNSERRDTTRNIESLGMPTSSPRFKPGVGEKIKHTLRTRQFDARWT
jgi:hypothetical protein